VNHFTYFFSPKYGDIRFHLALLMSLLVKTDFPVRLDLRRHQFRFGAENEFDLLIVLFYFSPKLQQLMGKFFVGQESFLF
jgi:hypothetical protein